jgi:hypothetical protein
MKIVYRQNYRIQKNVKLLEMKFEVVSLKKLESEDNEKDFILVQCKGKKMEKALCCTDGFS